MPRNVGRTVRNGFRVTCIGLLLALGLALLFATLVLHRSPRLPLPDMVVVPSVSFITIKWLGWTGLGAIALIWCCVRPLREKHVYFIADQLADAILTAISGVLALAVLTQRNAKTVAVGLIAALFVLIPLGGHAAIQFVEFHKKQSLISQLRSEIRNFLSYGALDGDLSALGRIVTMGKSTIPPTAIELQGSYDMIANLEASLREVSTHGPEERRRVLRQLYRDVLRVPSDTTYAEAKGSSEFTDQIYLEAFRARLAGLLSDQGYQSTMCDSASVGYHRVLSRAFQMPRSEDRRVLVGIARNGLGNCEMGLYRQHVFLGVGSATSVVEHMNQAATYYRQAVDPKLGGDASRRAQQRLYNNMADLEMYLLEASYHPRDIFRPTDLSDGLERTYDDFANPTRVTTWASRRVQELNQTGRNLKTSVPFITMAQIHALVYEALVRVQPNTAQQELGVGFHDLWTAFAIGDVRRDLIDHPDRYFLCRYVSRAMPASEVALLEARFDLSNMASRCPR